MKSTDIVGWIWDGGCYCVDCPPHRDATPIFAGGESDYLIACSDCGDSIIVSVFKEVQK